MSTRYQMKLPEYLLQIQLNLSKGSFNFSNFNSL
ncbi:hypothetical protein DYBT9275_05059 [Dyadobacter sp. CECT 9275]|uniref:Uncharacterized protein n=1 Tax=Dyadobacter helix TaxID=2822344 RepID=A0A916JGH4_9BACT|nr:hypothetical protein DYBT9275_05059 [Dyadobacter sp. CECT 9275]